VYDLFTVAKRWPNGPYQLQWCRNSHFPLVMLTCDIFLHLFTHLGYRKRIVLNTSSMPLDGAPTTPTWPRDDSRWPSLFHNSIEYYYWFPWTSTWSGGWIFEEFHSKTTSIYVVLRIGAYKIQMFWENVRTRRTGQCFPIGWLVTPDIDRNARKSSREGWH
jgi:hypothetical protein